MAFQQADVTAAINKFMENPFWAKKFHDAPVGAQKRLALSFFFSEKGKDDGFNLDEYRNLREYIENSLNADDLDYLIQNDSNEAAKAHFQELRANMQPTAQTTTQSAQTDASQQPSPQPQQDAPQAVVSDGGQPEEGQVAGTPPQG